MASPITLARTPTLESRDKMASIYGEVVRCFYFPLIWLKNYSDYFCQFREKSFERSVESERKIIHHFARFLAVSPQMHYSYLGDIVG